MREVRKYPQNAHFIFDWLHCWMHMQPQAQNFPVVIVTYLTFTIQLSFITSGINIATPFTTYIKEQQHAIIFVGWRCKNCGIHQRLSAQFGDGVFPQLNKWHWWRTIRVPIHNDYWTERWTNLRANSLQHEGDYRWSAKPTAYYSTYMIRRHLR
jgi:hypothetical protein